MRPVRFGNHLASRALDDMLVEQLVHFAVAGFVGLDQMAFGEDLVTFAQALMQGLNQPPRRALLCEHARGKAFQHAAHIDCVHDFLGSKRANDETARVELGEHAFLREYRQRFSHGRSRDAKLAGDFDFAHALAWSKLAVQNHFADSDDYARVFTSHFRIRSSGMVSTPLGASNHWSRQFNAC
jgi:hypothetical protein